MLRRDGNLVCYRIEKLADGDWMTGYYTDAIGEMSKKVCPVDNYMASGACWQATGIHAFYDPKKAFLAVDAMEGDPDRFTGPFRVVRLEIKQKRDIISREAQGGFYPCK